MKDIEDSRGKDGEKKVKIGQKTLELLVSDEFQ